MESEDSNCTKKYWESVQEDSDSVSHCFARYYYCWALYYGYSWALYRYYSWALIILVVHDATGWDWDRVSSGDGFHVTVRLQFIIFFYVIVYYFFCYFLFYYIFVISYFIIISLFHILLSFHYFIFYCHFVISYFIIISLFHYRRHHLL